MAGEKHREYLKSLIEFRFYKKYIDEQLAGDFAYDLYLLLNQQQEEIAALKADLSETRAEKQPIKEYVKNQWDKNGTERRITP